MVGSLENENPAVFIRSSDRVITSQELDDSIRDSIDAREIFDILYEVDYRPFC